MGLSPFRGCRGGYAPAAPAPNPDPSRWQLLALEQYDHAYVLVVRYFDATNYEGVKVMVFRGGFDPSERHLDPHFQPGSTSPIARFRPDEEGRRFAADLARSIGK